MLSRLEEIKDDDDDRTSLVKNKDDSVAIDMSQMGSEMEEYFKELKKLEDQIEGLRTTVTKLKESQAQSLSSTSAQQSKVFKQRIGRLAEDTRSTVREVKKGLEDMAEGTKSLKEEDLSKNTAVIRIREQQHARILREFVAVLKEYHDVQEQYKQQQTDRVVRQVKIVKKNATDEEIEQMLQQQTLEPKDIFKGDILTGAQQSTVEAVYAEVAETHRDILELEKQFFEVHELFRDFALLVQQQDVLVDNILHNVQTAVDYVDKGNQNLITAKKYQKKSRGCGVALILILIIIIVVAVLVVAALGGGLGIYFGALKGT